jgi:hypothetical protein
VTYIPSKDIGSMTEEERHQHYLSVNEALGLDPRLQLLKYTMMEKNDGSGERHLVLYSTKGATDAMRDIHGINIDKMDDSVIGGAIVFKASGTNAKGRHDIAVGSATIAGKSGKALENAFMIAQTRASRRLTLQFAGCGLLDESEVSDDKTVSLVNADLPLSEIGQPVDVSSAPGKDITAIKLPDMTQGSILPSVISLPAAPAPLPASVPQEEKRIANPAAGLKPVPASTMSAPDSVAPIAPAVQTDAAQGPTTEQMTTRRKRRTKAEIEAAKAADVLSAAQAPPAAITGQQAPQSPAITAQSVEERRELPRTEPLKGIEDATNAILRKHEVIEAPPATVVVPSDTPGAPPEVVAQAADDPMRHPPMVGTVPSEEQRRAYVDRLNKFRDECITSGMVPSHGMGPTRKIREFIKVVNRGSDLNNLTVEQWDYSFRFLSDTAKQHGMKELVLFMEQQIGVVDAPTA